MVWIGIFFRNQSKSKAFDPSLPNTEEEPATDGEIIERGVLHSSFWIYVGLLR